MQQRLYDAAVLHDDRIDRAHRLQLLLCDAFTTRSHGPDPNERGCNWRATIYSCSHSLKRVERAFCTTRRLLFKFAFFQLIESIVFNNATSRILHLLIKLCCIIHYLATIEIAHCQYFECVENAGGKKIQIKSK